MDSSILLNLPIPDLVQRQIEKFNLEDLHANVVCSFDINKSVEKLKKDNQKVIGIDIGGNKLMVGFFVTKNGEFTDCSKREYIESDTGENYLQFLEEISKKAIKDLILVGIAVAGYVKGTKLIAQPNIGGFENDLRKHYQNDFSLLFPTLKAVFNDAVCGLIYGSIKAKESYSSTKNVIYIINGSGFGAAVLKEDQIYATEPHLEVVSEFNKFNQEKPCGMFGRTYVCIESVASGEAGIEDIWLKKTGEKRDCKEISLAYQNGDKLAMELFDNSAVLMAHGVIGLGRAFEILKDQETTVACHGGVFNVSGYSERLKQILTKYLGFEPQILFTKDFSENACLDGAAIAALNL